jgi:hypothetical protein
MFCGSLNTSLNKLRPWICAPRNTKMRCESCVGRLTELQEIRMSLSSRKIILDRGVAQRHYLHIICRASKSDLIEFMALRTRRDTCQNLVCPRGSFQPHLCFFGIKVAKSLCFPSISVAAFSVQNRQELTPRRFVRWLKAPRLCVMSPPNRRNRKDTLHNSRLRFYMRYTECIMEVVPLGSMFSIVRPRT